MEELPREWFDGTKILLKIEDVANWSVANKELFIDALCIEGLRRGLEGIACTHYDRANMTVTFYVRPGTTPIWISDFTKTK